MQEAIAEVKKGLAGGGIPIGPVLVQGDPILGRGHSRRVHEGDTVIHAGIDCLRNAGRIGSYRNTVLSSTLMPCCLCAGAAVRSGIPEVVAGESQNVAGARAFMEEQGIGAIDLGPDAGIRMMKEFIRKNPRLWNGAGSSETAPPQPSYGLTAVLPSWLRLQISGQQNSGLPGMLSAPRSCILPLSPR